MKIGVFGAGAIGASLGVRLSAAGHQVTMIARPSLAKVAADLRVRTLEGRTLEPGPDLVVTTDAEQLAPVDLCLVTVKSKDTASAAQVLGPILRTDATVVSFQNGLHNANTLREHLDQTVAGGMVSYNVVRSSPSAFEQATRGPLIVEALAGQHGARLEELVQAFARGGDTLHLRADIADVMAGKLLLNLNNGVCAATGVSIAASIRCRKLRRCFSKLMREGLRAMKANGLRPRSIVGLPPSAIAWLLPLPDAIVLRAATKLAAIDPAAKSSTLADVEAGKTTEIDELCGEIVRLAQAAGLRAPANATVVRAVREHEATAGHPVFWSPERLEAEIANAEA